MKAIEIAEENDGLVSFDVADPFVVNLNKDEFQNLIAEHADVVFANQEEAKLLYGLSAEETVKKIMDTGAIAVVKLGAEGALVGKGGEVIKIDAVATTVVDTTGAGDMFASVSYMAFPKESLLKNVVRLQHLLLVMLLAASSKSF